MQAICAWNRAFVDRLWIWINSWDPSPAHFGSTIICFTFWATIDRAERLAPLFMQVIATSGSMPVSTLLFSSWKEYIVTLSFCCLSRVPRSVENTWVYPLFFDHEDDPSTSSFSYRLPRCCFSVMISSRSSSCKNSCRDHPIVQVHPCWSPKFLGFSVFVLHYTVMQHPPCV